MADASFEVHIVSARDPIAAGDDASIEVTVSVPESHADATLEWQVGWVAHGRTTNTEVVDEGTQHLGRVEADAPQTWRIPFSVPREGPITYEGHLLTVSWFVRVSLDIPWAIDPKSTFPFEVVPRTVGKKKRKKRSTAA
jgi:hypothetical protein